MTVLEIPEKQTELFNLRFSWRKLNDFTMNWNRNDSLELKQITKELSQKDARTIEHLCSEVHKIKDNLLTINKYLLTNIDDRRY